MIAGRNSSMDLKRILLLSFGQDADHDAGKLGVGGQEVEATGRACGDFDAPSRGQVARSSRHRCISGDGGGAVGATAPRPHAVASPSQTGASRCLVGVRHRDIRAGNYRLHLCRT